MTKVTTLEIAVITNIVALGSAVSAQLVHTGPAAVKQSQVNAVILNLKGKGLATRDGDVVALTAEGLAVHAELVGSVKDLDTLRAESNAELTRENPMDADELRITNELVSIRNRIRQIAGSLTTLEAELAPQTIADMLEEAQEPAVA